ncbi:MAG: 2'-5' RNA ligase family protein [Candidatus Babeliales bacterium]
MANTYVAFMLPDDLQEQIVAVQDELNARLKQQGLPLLKKRLPERLHITLQFIRKNDVSQEEIAKIVRALQAIAHEFKSIELAQNLAQAQFAFWGPVVVLVLKPHEELTALVAAVRKAFDNAGIEYDKKFPDYIPHLTIGSLDEASRNFLQQQKIQVPEIKTYKADALVLRSAGANAAHIFLKR